MPRLSSEGDSAGRRTAGFDELTFEDLPMAMPIPKIIEEAERQKLDIRWVGPGECDYDQSRSIANSRFSHRPAAIGYCGTADSVAALFRIFEGKAPKLRIRSGGHQHEGMCSADGVLLVDLSELDRIGWDPKKKRYQKLEPQLEELWIQPGVYLGDVYRKLEGCWKVLPAGGCSHVNVGGLVQGGGWGLSLRNFGLTSDNLLEAEVVLANGEKVFASNSQNQDLFWAIRGGGGGNFGVITNFKLQIHPLADTMTSFTLRWSREHRPALVRHWMESQNELPKELTTFGRIAVTSEKEAPAFILGGQFYGSAAKLKEHLKDFYDIAKPINEQYRERTKSASEASGDAKAEVLGSASGEMPLGSSAVEGSLTVLLSELVADLQPGAPLLAAEGQDKREAPTSTCSRSDGWAFQPHPHKVSSAFPKNRSKSAYDRLANDLIKVVESTEHDKAVNLYVSLHGFGGKVAEIAQNATAFPYRNKDFMLQFQAWWSDPASSQSEDYVRWIEDCRKGIEEAGVEGAFINFPDASLKAADRVELLHYYYAGNLPKLRKIKAEVDPLDVFSFGMSIPLP